MSLRRAAGRGVLWSGTGYVIQYAITFVFTVVTARLLDPSDFGLMGMAAIVLSVGSMVADGGTHSALIHRDHDVDAALNTASVSVPLAGLLAGLLGCASAPLLAAFYDDDRLVLITMVLSGVLLVRSFGLVTDSILQRRLQFKYRRAVVDPLGALVGGITATALALAGAGVWALVAQWYATMATLVAGSWILARFRPDVRKARFSTWRELTRYGRHIFGAHSVEMAGSYVDVMAIGRNLSTSAVGWYGAANRLSIMPVTGITHVAGSALFPAFSRMQHEPERLRDRFLEALRYVSLLTIPVCVAFAAIATPFMVTLFGEAWEPAAAVIAVLMIWAIPYSLLEVAMEAFKGRGRPEVVLYTSLLQFVVFAGYVATIWAMGWVTMERVAAGLGISMLAGVIASVLLARRHLRTGPAQLWHATRPALVGGAAAAVAVVPASWLWIGDMQGLRDVLGVHLGPVIPLLGMAAIVAITAGIFIAGCELVERGSVRGLVAEGRSLLRRD